ncbi:MAG TPA: metallophosphoesterase [Mycobacteriales bacterium]|nr:metallophosphoesterase [Mycobacteriales bacterium]
MSEGRLLATSDLHVAYPENRRIVTEDLHPRSDGDWLLVAGDVAEKVEDVEWALGLLADRFAQVVWAPGNHELWTARQDPVRLRGQHRYDHLVEVCRGLGVLNPEDDYATWDGAGGPVLVAPLLLLYDYSFRPDGTSTTEQALEAAYAAGVVCTDERVLHPDPWPDRAAWCQARVERTARRLAALPSDARTVLVNHFPLTRAPTRVLRHPEFALWCGTERTADWHRRFRAAAVVYGHLHIPRTSWEDGVRFEEVSVGYPRDRRRRGLPRGLLRDVLFPAAERAVAP